MPPADGGHVRGLHIGSIVLRVDDLERAAAFWEAALGYARSPHASDDWILLVALGGAGPKS